MKLLPKLIILSLPIIAIAACHPNGGLLGANIVSSNENFVTVSDPMGMPNGRLSVATQHCAQHGKTAVYQSQGGDSYECRGTTWCATYQCK